MYSNNKKKKVVVVSKEDKSKSLAFARNEFLARGGTFMRFLLRYGEPYEVELNDVEMELRGNCIFRMCVTDPDYVKSVKEFGDFHSLTYNVGDLPYAVVDNAVFLEVELDPTSKIVDTYQSSVKVEDFYDACSRIGGRVKCHLKIRVLNSRFGIQNRLRVHAFIVDVTSIGNEYYGKEGLPSIDEFKKMNIDSKKFHYHKGQICDEEHNKHGKYVLICRKDSNKETYSIVEESDYKKNKLTGIIPYHMSSAIWQQDIKENGLITVSAMDYANPKLYHYKVTLTYSPRKAWYPGKPDDTHEFRTLLVSKCIQHVKELELDTRGLWYDVGGKQGRSHVNMHIVSDLPPRYFRLVFSSWKEDVGLTWIEQMFDPLQWRIYASRNHGIFTNSQEKYQGGFAAFTKLIKFQYKTRGDATKIWNDLPTELVCKIMDYVLYDYEERGKNDTEDLDEKFKRLNTG
jgi:hypothetical protein